MALERVDMGGYTLTEQAPLATLNTLRVPARANLLADIRAGTISCAGRWVRGTRDWRI